MSEGCGSMAIQYPRRLLEVHCHLERLLVPPTWSTCLRNLYVFADAGLCFSIFVTCRVNSAERGNSCNSNNTNHSNNCNIRNNSNMVVSQNEGPPI